MFRALLSNWVAEWPQKAPVLQWESSGSAGLQWSHGVWTWRAYWHPESMMGCTVGILGFGRAYIRLWRTGNARERLWDVMWFVNRKDRRSNWLDEPGLVGKKSVCRQEKGLQTRWEWGAGTLGSPPFSLEPCLGRRCWKPGCISCLTLGRANARFPHLASRSKVCVGHDEFELFWTRFSLWKLLTKD